MIFLDTSILGAHYCPEVLSNLVEQALFSRSKSNFHIWVWVYLEFFSLLNKKVRIGELTATQAGEVATLFDDDLEIGD